MARDPYVLEFDKVGAPMLRDSVFLSPPVADPAPAPPPEQATAGDVVRRRDAVVDAARTLDDLTPDGVREFVTTRWQGRKVLQESDVETFAKDAQKQRIEDVVDALDHRVRSGVYGRVKAVRVELPRGYARNAIKAMSDDEIKHLVSRLRGRGWTSGQIRKHVARSLDDVKKRLGTQLSLPDDEFDLDVN